MKPLFTFCLACLLLLGGTGLSAAPLVVASFSAEHGQSFSLLVDGQPVARPVAPQVHLDYLAPGEHSVALGLNPAPLGQGGQAVRATVWLEEGFETNFVLTLRPGRGWQLRQVGMVALPGYGYLGQAANYPPPTPAPPLYNPPGGSAPAGPQPPVAGPGYPYPPAGPGYGAGTYAAVLNSQDAADLIARLQQYSFDDKRLSLLYQALSRTYVRADDLAAMVHAMTYSDSQQQAAKYGYAHLIDPQNFHRVLDALTFSTDANSVLNDLGLRRY